MQTQIIQPEKKIYIPCQHHWVLTKFGCCLKWQCLKCRKIYLGNDTPNGQILMPGDLSRLARNKRSQTAPTWQGLGPGGGSVAGCNPATNTLGTRTILTDADSTSAGIVCWKFTADCTGNLDKTYFYHIASASSAHLKIGVYLSDGAEPNANCTRIGLSGAITSGTTVGWKTDSSDIGGAVTNGNAYWVCIMPLVGETWNFYRYGTGGSQAARYESMTDYYTSPPAHLGPALITFSTGSVKGPSSLYVEIGP